MIAMSNVDHHLQQQQQCTLRTSLLQVLYRDVQVQHWDQAEQDAATAQAAAVDVEGGAQAADVGDVEHTLAMQADPVPSLRAREEAVAPNRRQQRRDEERLYFTLTRAEGAPLSIDTEHALEVRVLCRCHVCCWWMCVVLVFREPLVLASPRVTQLSTFFNLHAFI